MKISEIITDKYKLHIPPKVYYDLLADVREAEEEQEPCEDAVSRHEVAKVLLKYAHSTEGKAFADFLVSQINDLPSVSSSENPNTCEDDKPCTECSKYDHEKHNCPHFCHVIKGVLKDQANKTGHWIEIVDEIDKFGNKTYHHECSVCGCDKSGWGEYRYCPNCGAKMSEMPTGSEGSEKE